MKVIRFPTQAKWDHPLETLNWFQRLVRKFKRRKRANMAKIRLKNARSGR